MTVPIYQVDAFTDRAFAGNPAAVCLLPEPRDPSWMQSVAAEMNLSETAFLQPEGDGHRLRWFTPEVEVDLCGHATLATAHTLWVERGFDRDQELRFHTRSGRLTARRHGDLIELDFPSRVAAPAEAPAGLVEALGAEPSFVGSNRDDLVVVVDDPATVRALAPDFAALRSLGTRGVIVTAASDTGDYHFVSRFFAPGVGIDEDPVTGSAHCCLAPLWAERLGATRLRGFQASARGGVVDVELVGDRVRLGGRAVTVFRGELLV